MNTIEISKIIASMPADNSKSFGLCTKLADAQKFGFQLYVVRADEGFDVVAKWTVPDSFDSDWDSITGNPFGMGTPYTERRKHVATAFEAAEVYDAAKPLVSKRCGHMIGWR